MSLVSIHTAWLIPGEKTPCDIYFYFRGSYVVALKSGAEISLEFVAKLYKTEYPLAYIERARQKEWQDWTQLRHPQLQASDATPPVKEEKTNPKLYGNKRSEFLNQLERSLKVKSAALDDANARFETCVELIRKVVQGPVWDWYFLQFHEPPDLFYHNARVAFLSALLWYKAKLKASPELENLIQAAAIHELEGDPALSLNAIVSEKTIKTLSQEGRPIAKEIIDQIRVQDELVSGRGFPQSLKGAQVPMHARIFALCNHFDHYRLRAKGNSRREKFENVKKSMEARKQDYDPKLWEDFWQMLGEEIEVVV